MKHLLPWFGGAPWLAKITTSRWALPAVFGTISVPVVVAIVAQSQRILSEWARNPLPMTVALAAQALIVLATLRWVAGDEPPATTAILHALLWGGFVATAISGHVNSFVESHFDGLVYDLASAPLIEEMTKALGIYWAVRRSELHGARAGIVLAGLIGLGFSLVEHTSQYSQTDSLVGAFLANGIYGAFTRSFYTLWIGLAVGRAVSRQRPMAASVAWGLSLAVLWHFMWNATNVHFDRTGSLALRLPFDLLYISTSIGVLIFLVRWRRSTNTTV